MMTEIVAITTRKAAAVTFNTTNTINKHSEESNSIYQADAMPDSPRKQAADAPHTLRKYNKNMHDGQTIV